MPPMKFDNIDFSEDSDSQGEVLSISEIFLRHIRKISDICCQEFTGGYWEKRPVRTESGVMFSEIYHMDVRESYCNAIDFLIDMLYPLADDDFRKFIDENEDIDAEETDINKKLIKKRKTFKEMNKMFDRINFWKSSNTFSEGKFK